MPPRTRLGRLFQALAWAQWDELERVPPAAAADTPGLWVCKSPDTPLPAGAVLGACQECSAPIQHQPDGPTNSRRVCIDCAAQILKGLPIRFKRLKKEGD